MQRIIREIRILGKRKVKMYKVLVFGVTENPGGVESFLLSYYRKIDRNIIQFDFLCNTHKKVAYEDELISLGAKVIHIAMRSKNPVKYYRELNSFMRANASEYSAVWVNVCSLANIDYIKIAKKYGVRKRIIHSHNSQNMDSRLRGFLHNINKNNIQKYATDFWACSQEAADWFYNKSLMSQVVIIKNAIDLSRFEFSVEKRKQIRAKYHLENAYVLGNVGRLHFQKNQIFALDILKKLLDKKPNSFLILVGQGEDETKLKNHAVELDISDHVIFAGVQSDVNAYLSSFDLFLFPSVFEGLSIAGLEAQANGVPVLASNGVIPEELKLSDNFHFKKLDDGADSWADEIIHISETDVRSDEGKINSCFTRAGYNIDYEAKRLEKLLIE